MPDAPQQVGRGPVALTKVKDGATAVVTYQSGTADWNEASATFWVERVVAIGLHLTVVVALFADRHDGTSATRPTGVAWGAST